MRCNLGAYFDKLGEMYATKDISKVEPYISKSGNVLDTFESNVEDNKFSGLDIQSFEIKNFKSNTGLSNVRIKADIETVRTMDSLSSPSTFTTEYVVNYDSETKEFKIVSFNDK